VVIKGRSVGHATNLARYLERDPKNRSVEVVEIRGAAAKDLQGALQEWALTAAGTRCEKPLYSASINPQQHEKLTREQYLRAADILEQKLGLTGQPRALVIQVNDKGREHCHVVWSRIDIERMRAIPDSHNFRKHELAAREIERVLGLERVQGAHVERDGRERPQRAPNQAEMQQAQRGMHPHQVREFITDLWRRSDNGQAFKAALEHEGWILARGDRRDFCIVDPFGHEHSLVRRIQGAFAQDVRHKLRDIDRGNLPSVDEAKRIQRDRHPVLAPEQTRQHHAERAQQRRDAGVARSIAILPRAITAPAATIARTHSATRSAFKAASRIADGIASLVEGLFGGAPAHPDRRTEAEVRREQVRLEQQQPAPQEVRNQTAIEQSQDDLTRRRQDFGRLYGHDKPLEPLSEAELRIRQQQRERDDRERSR
jgi:hypothetical protein